MPDLYCSDWQSEALGEIAGSNAMDVCDGARLILHSGASCSVAVRHGVTRHQNTYADCQGARAIVTGIHATFIFDGRVPVGRAACHLVATWALSPL